MAIWSSLLGLYKAKQVCKKVLFVTGTSRSGTSTMADFLRGDRRIVMGRERYADVLDRGELSPKHFERDRFLFGFRLDDSHHLVHQPYYAAAAEYFEQARWVGDKLPNLFEHYDTIFAAFPNARIINMLRDPLSVAQSFQKRADATKKLQNQGEPIEHRWPVDRGWQAGVEEWNQSIREVLRIVDERSIFVLDYATLYRDHSTLEGLYNFLGLDLTPTIRELWNEKGVQRDEIEVIRAQNKDAREIIDQVNAQADWDGYQKLVAIATRQRSCTI